MNWCSLRRELALSPDRTQASILLVIVSPDLVTDCSLFLTLSSLCCWIMYKRRRRDLGCFHKWGIIAPAPTPSVIY